MRIAICENDQTIIQEFIQKCTDLGYRDVSTFKSVDEVIEKSKEMSITLLFLNVQTGEKIKNIFEYVYPFMYIALYEVGNSGNSANVFGRNIVSYNTTIYSKFEIQKIVEKIMWFNFDYSFINLSDDNIVLCRDVMYLYSNNKYTVFVMSNGSEILSRRSLISWENELKEQGYCAISRSAVINLKYYKKIEDHFVIMQNNINIPISRQHYKKLKQTISWYHMYRLRYQGSY